MLVTETPILRRFWYCIAPSFEITDSPFPFRLLGESIVIWRDREGKVNAVQDRCLHRTARLSLGWIDNGNIVCPYHGWTYDQTGTCVKVPQDLVHRPRPFAIPSYHCAERYNYIWVSLEEPMFDIPELPEFDQSEYRQVIEFREEWAAHPLRIIENGFDGAHLTFVHKNTFGDPDPTVTSQRIDPRPDGFSAYSEYDVRTPDHMKDALATSDDKTTRTSENRFYLPFSRLGHLCYPDGLENILCTFITPIDNTRTQFVQWVVRNDTAEKVPPAAVVAFDREITLEDRGILESTEAEVFLDLTQSKEMHMVADRPGLNMRRMLKALIDGRDANAAGDDGALVLEHT